MNSTKELILQKSFVLFLQKGYQSVSMENIQTETGLSRGAIYHYFKSKNLIYQMVIDEYLLSALSVFSGVPENEKSTLKQAIENNLKYRKNLMKNLQKITSNKIDDFFYF